MTVEKEDYEISIKDILVDKSATIADIYGYISYEFGDPVFNVSRIAFSNDEHVYVEGEHDTAYLTEDEKVFIKFPDDEEDEDDEL